MDTFPAAREKVRRAVTSLERLHAVLIGFAITQGARTFLEPWLAKCRDTAHQPCSTPDIPASAILLFLALVATAIPFFHGANRHLEYTHLDANGPFVRREFMVDYTLLFLEGAVFVAIGLSVVNVRHFVIACIALVILDSFWAITTRVFLKKRKLETAHVTRWLRLNLYSIVGLAMARLFWDHAVALPVEGAPFINDAAWWLLILAIIRTYADYRQNADWFFGMSVLPTGDVT